MRIRESPFKLKLTITAAARPTSGQARLKNEIDCATIGRSEVKIRGGIATTCSGLPLCTTAFFPQQPLGGYVKYLDELIERNRAKRENQVRNANLNSAVEANDAYWQRRREKKC
jgi:hypothetical protein